jgi:hypothetical protein
MLVGSKECRLPRDGSLKAAARVRIPSGYTVGLHNNFHDDSRTCSSILADCLRTDAGLHATGRPATCGLAVPQRDSTCATASGARKPRAGGRARADALKWRATLGAAENSSNDHRVLSMTIHGGIRTSCGLVEDQLIGRPCVRVAVQTPCWTTVRPSPRRDRTVPGRARDRRAAA